MSPTSTSNSLNETTQSKASDPSVAPSNIGSNSASAISTDATSATTQNKGSAAPIPNVMNTSSPRAQAELHNRDDRSVQAGFDPLAEVDRGRESSNGGYLAHTFDDSELDPPLAPGSHRFVGQHEPLDFDSKMNSPQGGKNASN